MEEVVNQAKNQKLVKILSWILIVASVLVLLKEVFLTQGYLAMFNMEQITKNFDPPIEINFTLYYIKSGIEFLLCIVVFVSATFVLKYKNFWRKVLVYGLIASIIFLFVSPLIDFYNFPTVKIKGIVDDIYGQFLRLDFRNGDLRKKADSIKWNLNKLTEVVFEAKLKMVVSNSSESSN